MVDQQVNILFNEEIDKYIKVVEAFEAKDFDEEEAKMWASVYKNFLDNKKLT